MPWIFDQHFDGPDEVVDFLDATWQDAPRFTDDPWIALEADLAYPGPPYPGFLLRVSTAIGEQLRVTVGEVPRHETPLRVVATELIVGPHGFSIQAGGRFESVSVVSGNYDAEVWVAPLGKGRTLDVSIVLGSPKPRRLGPKP